MDETLIGPDATEKDICNKVYDLICKMPLWSKRQIQVGSENGNIVFMKQGVRLEFPPEYIVAVGTSRINSIFNVIEKSD